MRCILISVRLRLSYTCIRNPRACRRVKKCAFSAVDDFEVKEASDTDGFTHEEAFEMLDDPDAAANGDADEDRIEDSNVDMEVAVRSTTSVSAMF